MPIVAYLPPMRSVNRSALRDFRTLNGWSLGDLAERAGTNKGYLSKIENGKATNPSPELLLRLASSLAVDIASITQTHGPCDHSEMAAA